MKLGKSLARKVVLVGLAAVLGVFSVVSLTGCMTQSIDKDDPFIGDYQCYGIVDCTYDDTFSMGQAHTLAGTTDSSPFYLSVYDTGKYDMNWVSGETKSGTWMDSKTQKLLDADLYYIYADQTTYKMFAKFSDTGCFMPDGDAGGAYLVEKSAQYEGMTYAQACTFAVADYLMAYNDYTSDNDLREGLVAAGCSTDDINYLFANKKFDYSTK